MVSREIYRGLLDSVVENKGNALDGEQTSFLELKVAPEDIGKVIGKQGGNVQAIRVILGAAGMKLKKKFILEIIEKT